MGNLPKKAARKGEGETLVNSGDYRVEMRENGKGIIFFVCPHDGCGDRCHLLISPPLKPGEADHQGHGWQWNEERKTLSPSIQRMDKAHCTHHFSLIDGMWVP